MRRALHLVLACGLAWLALHTYLPHIEAGRLGRISGDARQQIVPLFRYFDATVLPDDFASEYYRRAFLPTGFKAFYWLLARCFDPADVSFVLPYLLMLVFTACLGRAAYRVGGAVASTAVMALAGSSRFFFVKMMGGVPHSFAFPIAALVLLGVLAERRALLVAATLLGAALYPAVGVVAGAVLLAQLVAPRSLGGFERSAALRSRLLEVAATALGAGAILLPQVLGSLGQGPLVEPGSTAYPEHSLGGRYVELAPSLVELPAALAQRAWQLVQEPFGGLAGPALGIGGLAVAASWRRDIRARRLALVVGVAVLAYLVSAVLAPIPTLSGRYLHYFLPTALVTALAFAVEWLRRRLERRPWLSGGLGALVIAGALAFGLSSGGRVDRRAGQRIDLAAEAPLYRFLASLPRDARVAGWPRGPIENVPFAARRPAFLSYETHQAFHVSYLLEMRARMRALIDAYCARVADPLLALRDRFGVDFLIVDSRHFDRATPPRYFAPFDAWIEAAWRGSGESASRDFLLPHLGPPVEVFRLGALRVLDLHALDATWGSTFGAAPQAAPADAAPDILLVLVDSLRPDHLGIYGYPKPTSPFLDRWAAGARKFTSAYTNATHTRMAVASLFTGSRPTVHRVRQVDLDGRDAAGSQLLATDALHGAFTTLAEALRAKGYETWGFSTNPHVTQQLGFDQGFSAWHETVNRDGAVLLAKFERELEAKRSQSSGRPLFAYLHFMDVHNPYAPPPPFDAQFAPPVRGRVVFRNGRANASPEDVAWSIGQYDGDIRYFDLLFERLASTWESGGGRPRVTIVISDHGEEFMEHGGLGHGTSVHREQARIALLWKGPGVQSGSFEPPVQTLDVSRAILDAAGAEIAQTFQGRSMRDWSRSVPIYSESRTGMSGVRCGPWLLVRDRGSPAFAEDYHLGLDPEELRARSAFASLEAPELGTLRSCLTQFVEGDRALAEGLGSPRRIPMGDEQREALKAIGYLAD